MADRPAADRRGGTNQPNARFDRVRRPDPAVARDREVAGKEALFSTAPQAPPSTVGLVICERCDIEAGVDLSDVPAMMWPPPVLVNPITRKVFARCPSCEQKSWLRVRQGQTLRALLARG